MHDPQVPAPDSTAVPAFKEIQHVSAAMLAERYFAGRAAHNSEELLVAAT
jgi:hypothetical protein